MIAVASYYGAFMLALLGFTFAYESGRVAQRGKADGVGHTVIAWVFFALAAWALKAPGVASVTALGICQAGVSALWCSPPQRKGITLVMGYLYALGGLLSSIAIVLHLAR